MGFSSTKSDLDKLDWSIMEGNIGPSPEITEGMDKNFSLSLALSVSTS